MSNRTRTRKNEDTEPNSEVVHFTPELIREKWLPAGAEVLRILRREMDHPLEAHAFLSWLMRFLCDTQGLGDVAWEWQEPSDKPDEPGKATVQMTAQ